MVKPARRLFYPVLLGLLLSLAGCSEDWGIDQHGETVTGDALKGRWLVINYWAEWCGPCRTEIPELNALSDEDALEVLGVNFDGLQGDELAQASTAMGIDFRVLALDPAERLKLPRTPVLPVTYLVDANGEVREQLVGEQTEEGIKGRLAQLRAQ